ncbi:hypothetical protein BKA70DRAFT_1567295 [Coprinopsis sp. MPI-PUGE-AT-0042]|nr:hypothetical protein BKA70DRAFT_1567295 [Coprinopsis sp. MPI-PUGE-AT-0042]
MRGFHHLFSSSPKNCDTILPPFPPCTVYGSLVMKLLFHPSPLPSPQSGSVGIDELAMFCPDAKRAVYRETRTRLLKRFTKGESWSTHHWIIKFADQSIALQKLQNPDYLPSLDNTLSRSILPPRIRPSRKAS